MLNKKKGLMSAAFALASSMTMAGSMGPVNPCPDYVFPTGFYVGASIGPIMNLIGQPSFYTGFEGTASAGYGKLFDRFWYMGAEIFGGDSLDMYDRPPVVADVVFHRGSVRSTWQYGASLLPGLMVNDHTLGYFRGGFVEQRFVNMGVNKSGWQAGIGTQTNVYDNFDLRLEYVISGYKLVSAPERRLEDHHRFVNEQRPYSNQLNFGFVYKFV